MDVKKQSLMVKSFIVKDHQAVEKVLDYLNNQSTVAERIYLRALLASQKELMNKKITTDFNGNY